MPRKKDKHCQPAIIRLPLIRPRGENQEQFFAELKECGHYCDKIRNAAMRYWQRWREDNPDWDPDVKTNSKGEPKKRKSGELIYVNCPAPKIPVGGKDMTFTTAAYHHVRKLFPLVSSSVASTLTQQIWKRLRQKAKWVAGNVALYEWQAVMDYEVSAPSYRSRVIPVPNQRFTIEWKDKGCWIEFNLWSKDRPGTTRFKCECKVAKLPSGLKELVLGGISGEIKIGDSSIIPPGLKRRRFWELHLMLHVPNKTSDCDVDNRLVLTAADGDGSRPFIAELPDGTRIPVGSGVPLIREHQRLTTRRKSIRAANRIGFMKGGHGSRRIMRAITSENRRYGGMEMAFCRQLADDIYRLCLRNDCGTVEYREPAVWQRDGSWFAENDTPFNWQLQLDRLYGKLQRRGIVLAVKDDKSAAIKTSE